MKLKWLQLTRCYNLLCAYCIIHQLHETLDCKRCMKFLGWDIGCGILIVFYIHQLLNIKVMDETKGNTFESEV